MYCCKLLAELGADVIKVEKPGGDEGRRQAPFIKDTPGAERSLPFLSLNTSKRSITLNLEAKAGASIFRKLVRTSDVVVESFMPDYLGSLGLGYDSLKSINPRVVLTSVTPFGQTGPYRSFRGTDLTAQAMGGLMNRIGYIEDPPCRIGGDQSHFLSSVQAATGTLLALYWRDFTGSGQHVDVSMQESVANVDSYGVPTYYVRKEVMGRRGLFHALGSAAIWECKDGYVRYYPGGERDVGGWDEMVEWMDSEGAAGDLKDPKWQDHQARFREVDHVVEVVTAFFKRHGKSELAAEGQRRGIMIYPTNNIADLLEDPQLAGEGFFVEIDHPEADSRLTYPGHPYRLSETPWKLQGRPPLAGEHNSEIFERELGISGVELKALRDSGVI